MKKYLLVAAVGLLTTAGVTATVLHHNQKKATTKHTSKCCMHHSQCKISSKNACY